MPRTANNPRRLPDEVDFEFTSHGSVWLCWPQNDDARAWLADHVDPDNSVWLPGGALSVEPRYVTSLAEALEDDGFTTRV